MAAPPARIVSKDGKYSLQVHGKPFLILGAQIHNSSAWPERLETVWPQITALGANTVEAPVYWEALEPQPGHFDFTNVDALLVGARRHGLHVILLWFGSWKNGTMDYVPEWIKQDETRFPRIRDKAGNPINSLSPHGMRTLEADQRAFRALLAHLRETDQQGTVILVQVENEAGTLGAGRDYSPQSNVLFAGSVPDALTARLKQPPGTWSAVFGAEAAEAFNAYHIATYINAVAAAGKAEYDLPMYINVWAREGGFERPGETYPSGGATSNMIAIWKAAAPAIDLLALDNYQQNSERNRALCRTYARPDNPLLVPETGGSVVFARYMFRTLAEFGALGFAPFGVDQDKPELDPRLRSMAANFHLLRGAIPLLTASQQAGTLHASIEDELVANELIRLKTLDALVTFGTANALEVLSAKNALERHGRLLLIESSANEVFLIGFQARVQFRRKPNGANGSARFLSVEEGSFDDTQWKPLRRWNGDEIFGGLSLPASGGILRVKFVD